MLIVSVSLQLSGMRVYDIEKGNLIIGIGQYGNCLYGEILGFSIIKRWFSKSASYVRPVKPSSITRLVQELDE